MYLMYVTKDYELEDIYNMPKQGIDYLFEKMENINE